ncbi:TBC1 domain family member 12 [Austrofundulus limnaeus]|uniref:TBC1 domain family member 12-like n=1 Tax=Austrofundulus limnaeus TaxID=52670 RepID=A0A2I4AIX6_AUSLI|nr:PREDICTED: TBC1 domain family member 12-like [Austrofundulus limnaeus]XP_013878464.1 PREDICTED: TBC1 domain family member 12-like [Austrofundulus limnaeus]
METAKENGGSFSVDLNDNEEESGGGAVKPGHRPYTALKDRSLALLAGVSGGQAAVRNRSYATRTERNVNSDDPEMPVSADGRLTGRFAHSCIISGGCGGLNGFSESLGPDDLEAEGGGGGLASCPAVLGDLISSQMLQEEEGGETPECFASGGCIRTSTPRDRLSCPAKLQQICSEVGLSCPRANMPNGVVDRPGRGSPEGDMKLLILGQKLGLCDGEEVKVANGGLHIFNPACEWTGSGFNPANRDSETRQGEEPGWGQSDLSGQLHLQEQEASPAAEPPHSPTPESSANPPSPCPSSPFNVNRGSTQEENFRDLCPPIRPQSLRTNPNISVSLSCDATPLSPDEDMGFYFEQEGYEEDLRTVLDSGRRQSAPDPLSEQTDCQDHKVMPKRFGIADFFTRSLFSRKSKEPKATSHNATGWRLFGKTAEREDDQSKEVSSLSTPQQEEVRDSDVSSCPQRPTSAGRRKNLDFEPLSTTALILEDRPVNLPAKSVEETQRHKLEYEEMVAGAKRREMKEAQKKKRQMKERHRQEDSISNAMVIWNNEILPHWDTVKGTRRVRELWWQGLPPGVRGRVWSLAIGNELNITPELYEIFLSRAKEKWRSYSETSSMNDNESDGGASLADRESSLDLIKLDISRTFPSLFIFQKGGPYHDLLHSVLGAYTCYRPDIGYVQGMSFIAAVLILNLEEAEAFITFANLLNKPCQMAFFRVDHDLMLKYFAAFEIFFEENLPRLFNHFQTNNLTPDLYLIDWIFTLYSKSLPLDVACRVWDVFCRDGEESLFRTGLGILRLYEDVLMQMDFIHIAQFLTRLPEDLQPQTLFSSMANTHMISRNRRWAQVFSALMKDGNNREAEKTGSPALRS